MRLVPKIRELISHDIQALGSLPEFKNATKFWKPVRCPCTICKTYIPPIGFVYWMQFYTFVLIIYCVEYGNFAWFLVGGNYRAWVVFRDSGQFNRGSREIFSSKVSSPGDQVRFLYFLKWFCLYFTLLFYLVHDSWLRSVIGYFYCIFKYISVLVVNFE